MFEFLDNFEKRMEWMGISNSIVNRKGRNTELEGLFEENELTNIIVSVLLFIMEKTLEENNECEMYHIEAFLEQLTREYYVKAFHPAQIREIAGYVVKDILQNNGVRYTYPLINYSKKAVEEVTIRLIFDKIVEENNERKIIYMLTNQGYEFLFRMREVDEEIQLTMEQLKLKEYIKRKKFTSAVRQSVELITLVRQKKKDLESFMLSIRQNIHNVDVETYEALIKSTYSMLTEEYETMDDIRKMIQLAEARLAEDSGSGRELEQKLLKARSEIMEIQHNIGLVISEQRDLILHRTSLTDLYMDTIKRSFEFSFEKRYDFEEVIMKNLERADVVLDRCLSLLQPLLQPAGNRLLGIGDMYAPQLIFKEMESQDPLLVNKEEYDDTMERERIRKISDRNVAAFSLIASETIGAGEIRLSRLLELTRERDPELYREVIRDRCIFLMALKLYNIGQIDVSGFYQGSGRMILQMSEEFHVEYCLARVRDTVAGMERIRALQIEKTGEEMEISMEKIEDGIKIAETVRISDLCFKAVI